MHKRFLASTVLAALLFSQSSNLLLAALCPHLQSPQVSCTKHFAESTMSHDDMGDMHMDSMEHMDSMDDHIAATHEPAFDRFPNAVALGQPVGLCTHCAAHSRTTPTSVSFTEIEASKRSGSFAVPQVVPKVVSVEMSSLAALTLRVHGPPGETTPRHVLINIFRI